jgi:Leucine-rich repeat (LRR) protein
MQAVFLKNNRIITRDLPFISCLPNLRKADLSGNGIHFLPESYLLKRLEKLEFLLLHSNQLIGLR